MLETLKFGEGNWANKTDSTLAYSDQYRNFQPIPFDFTRATTATRVNKAGLIESVNEGIARIDYSDSTQGALLLEPERTNLIPYSNSFSNWSINSGNSTISSNNAISPDGGLNADRFVSGSGGYIYESLTCLAESEYTFSFYIKNIDYVNNALALYDESNSAFFFKDVSYSTTNDWSRITYSFTTPVGCTSLRVYPQRKADGLGSFYIYGAQLEAASYATSYIPTDGATATRNQEICTNATPEINSAEGVLYTEISALVNDLTKRSIALSNGGSANRVLFRYDNVSNKLRVYVVRSGVIELGLAFVATDILDNLKVAVKYKENDFALWVNGIEVDTNTSGNTPIGLNTLQFANGVNGEFFYGNTKGLKLYNTALTDAQLQTLTTL